jgi:hypothetical protein
VSKRSISSSVHSWSEKHDAPRNVEKGVVQPGKHRKKRVQPIENGSLNNKNKKRAWTNESLYLDHQKIKIRSTKIADSTSKTRDLNNTSIEKSRIVKGEMGKIMRLHQETEGLNSQT